MSERNITAKLEIKNLLQAGFIREVAYPKWLSNVVMVRKPSGEWRMCVDFTNLNLACPKDRHPLPSIDSLVDRSSGNKILSFMDVHSTTIKSKCIKKMKKKKAFITNFITFCYIVMPFGLKNVDATFQRLMDKVFKDQIGKNVEVYVDDILVKSAEEENTGKT